MLETNYGVQEYLSQKNQSQSQLSVNNDTIVDDQNKNGLKTLQHKLKQRHRTLISAKNMGDMESQSRTLNNNEMPTTIALATV